MTVHNLNLERLKALRHRTIDLANEFITILVSDTGEFKDMNKIERAWCDFLWEIDEEMRRLTKEAKNRNDDDGDDIA